MNWKITLAAVAAAGALVWAPAFFAQGAPPQGQQPGGQASIDDATLDKFASAYGEIREIHDDYSGRLQEVDNQEAAMELQREAQKEMLQVVQDNDLTVSEYNQVAAMMNESPEVREKENKKLQQ